MQNNRSKKMVSTLLIIVFAIVFILIGRKTGQQSKAPAQPEQSTGSQSVIAPDAPLHYTKHARCRMQCRDITEAEIREVLQEGHINYQKSDLQDRPCPTYAIEDQVADGQNLRIVFGLCGREVKVITCIDLEQDHDCACS